MPALLPSFPLVSREIASRILGGESPVTISGGELNRKEAHQWGLDGARETPASWLVRDLPLEGFQPRNSAVARWLVHVHQRGAWSTLIAAVRHPDGRQMRRLDVIDEITPEDLNRGVTTGVERAFERAGERLANIDEGDHRTISCWPSFWPRLPRSASLLTSPAALAAEGRVMHHCVGGYARSVEQRQCWIVSIVSQRGRSTVELRPDGSIAQHRGPYNREPHPRHVALMCAWQNRLLRHGATRRRAA